MVARPPWNFASLAILRTGVSSGGKSYPAKYVPSRHRFGCATLQSLRSCQTGYKVKRESDLSHPEARAVFIAAPETNCEDGTGFGCCLGISWLSLNSLLTTLHLPAEKSNYFTDIQFIA